MTPLEHSVLMLQKHSIDQKSPDLPSAAHQSIIQGSLNCVITFASARGGLEFVYKVDNLSHLNLVS